MAKFLLRNFPEILRDPELFHIKSRDNKLVVQDFSPAFVGQD